MSSFWYCLRTIICEGGISRYKVVKGGLIICGLEENEVKKAQQERAKIFVLFDHFTNFSLSRLEHLICIIIVVFVVYVCRGLSFVVSASLENFMGQRFCNVVSLSSFLVVNHSLFEFSVGSKVFAIDKVEVSEEVGMIFLLNRNVIPTAGMTTGFTFLPFTTEDEKEFWIRSGAFSGFSFQAICR